MMRVNKRLTAIIAAMVTAVSSLGAGASHGQTVAEWRRLLDLHLQNAVNVGHLTPVPVPDLAGEKDCQINIINDKILDQHGDGIVRGIAALKESDKTAAEAHFSSAIKALAKFAGSLYCLDTERVHWWDRAIADYWKMHFTNDEVKCDAISATWNPALLIVDVVQFTGQSEIVSTISNSSKTCFGCLQRYPIDTYGAAWLDEFASGQLRRVSGRLALNNLLGALTDPSRLGLGFCGLIDHAAAKENALICAAPIKPSLYSLGQAAGLLSCCGPDHVKLQNIRFALRHRRRNLDSASRENSHCSDCYPACG